MKLAQFNKNGIERFGGYLDSLENNPSVPLPLHYLGEQSLLDPIPDAPEIERRHFTARVEAAEYLHQLLSGVRLKDVERNIGLWAWLTLFYFDEVCPPDNGSHFPQARARYIPDSNFQRYYRHLLAGPYFIYKAHLSNPDRALVVLCQPLHKPGDIVEQIVSRQELVTNGGIMEAATKLYIDTKTRRPKPGAASIPNRVRGKKRVFFPRRSTTGGMVRRFVEVLNQLDVTRDLYAMTAQEILDALPEEFNRFR